MQTLSTCLWQYPMVTTHKIKYQSDQLKRKEEKRLDFFFITIILGYCDAQKLFQS